MHSTAFFNFGQREKEVREGGGKKKAFLPYHFFFTEKGKKEKAARK